MVRGARTQFSGTALRNPAIPALRPQLPVLIGLQWSVRSSDLGLRDMEGKMIEKQTRIFCKPQASVDPSSKSETMNFQETPVTTSTTRAPTAP